MDFEELQEKVLDWADDKDLLHHENHRKQFGKFMEESIELSYEHEAYYLGIKEEVTNDFKMEFGDVMVTLIILAEQLGMDPVQCLEMAYKKISQRKGKTIDGQFVKEEDLEDEI